MQNHEPAHTPDLRLALRKLFTAFPPYKQTDEARKEQYQLYYDRLRALPADLVERTVLELIDTASFLPKIGTIRTRVKAYMKQRVSTRPAEPLVAHSDCVPPPVAGEQAPPVTGPCPRIRDVDGGRDPCGQPYRYAAALARWLRGQGEQLLCTGCAGEYLAEQRQTRSQEAIWAESALARLSPQYPPSADEVQRLRDAGFGRRLNELLSDIVADSRRLH